MVKRGLILGGTLVLFSGVLVSNTFADDNLDFSITVQNASLQLTVPPTANLDLTPTSANADFKSTNLTIKVGTNNATGYTLTMSVPSTDISRQNAASGDPVIGTLSSQTGGYSENDFTVNKWGYKITGDNYFPITTTLAPSQWVTDGPANNVDNIITLASKVNTAIPAGTYKTTLTFSVVANPELDSSAFTIIYNPNGGTGTMPPTTITYGQTGTIAASTLTAPTGYIFDGWASTAQGGAPYFDAGAPYTAPADDTDGTYKILYAMWKPAGTPTPSGGSSGSTPGTTLQRAYEMAYTAAHKGMYEEDTAGSGTYHYVNSWNGATYQGQGRDVRFLIQDMTPEICASATAIDSEALVLDIRDQKSYWIAKLADGKCWMTQNLDLDLETTPTNVLALTSNNTDLTQFGQTGYTTADGYRNENGVITWEPERSTIPSSSITSAGAIPGYEHDAYNPYSVDLGNWYWTDEWYTYADNNFLDIDNNGAGDKFFQSPRPVKGTHAHVGNRYNYSAAVASNNTSGYTGYTYDNPSASPQNSICPKGWKLPVVTSYTNDTIGDNDFYNLWVMYHQTSDAYYFTISPLYFMRGGSVFYNQLNKAGIDGAYWSSTTWSSSKAFFLYLTGNGVNAGQYDNRLDGHAVRCVSR